MGNSSITDVSTRFLILSDTHNFELRDSDGVERATEWPLDGNFPRVDVLLHCGDLTHCGGLASYKKALELLGSFEAELKLVIAGNHDLELDPAFWKTHLDEGDDEEDHDRAMELMTEDLADEAGIVFLEEGTYDFELSNGARFTVYA